MYYAPHVHILDPHTTVFAKVGSDTFVTSQNLNGSGALIISEKHATTNPLTHGLIASRKRVHIGSHYYSYSLSPVI